jgi:hypothetical protein
MRQCRDKDTDTRPLYMISKVRLKTSLKYCRKQPKSDESQHRAQSTEHRAQSTDEMGGS